MARKNNLLDPDALEREAFFDGFERPDTPEEPAEQLISDRVDTLEQLDLEKELLDRYYETRELILNNRGSSLGQKSSAMSRITAILKEMIEMQTKLHTMERVKTLESVLITVLQEFPDIKQRFLDQYKKALEDAS